MEAAGPSMEAMQSTSQSTQLKNAAKKYPNKYQPPSSRSKYRQNNIPSPKISTPNGPGSTNRYHPNNYNMKYSGNRYLQDSIPYTSRFPPSEPIAFPTNSPQTGPISSKRSQESVAPFPNRTPTVDSLKITVNNDTNPPQRTVQNDVTDPPQRTLQSDVRPLQRHFQFNFPLSRPFQYDRPHVTKKNTPPFKPRIQGKNQETMQQVNGEPYRTFQYDNHSPKQSSKENTHRLKPRIQGQNQESTVQGNGEASYQQRPNWRQRKLQASNPNEEEDIHKKVIVTGEY